MDSLSFATSCIHSLSLKFNELGERVYSRANSGRVFETAQAVDPNSSPLIAVFASDKSYSGQNQGMHPKYGKFSEAF